MGYKRAREEKRRLERLCVAAGNNYGSGIWYDPKKCRFRRYWLGAKSGYRKLLKRRLKSRCAEAEGHPAVRSIPKSI